MADEKLVALLKRDVGAWNRQRYERPGPVDLRAARLSQANLRGANLTRADLSMADLSGVNLSRADLSMANLSGASLTGADLSRTADLSRANLSMVDLSRANLSRANLSMASLFEADLSMADLSKAMFYNTAVCECATLHLALNLDAVLHIGRSSLDPVTLRACVTHLPDAFLQGVGYTLDEIATLRALYATAIQFYSCFLSHAGADAEFVERLRTDLLAANVNCWHFRHDMQGGRFWRAQIDDAIKVHDKLVLVCSEQSLQRENVVAEVIAAMDREREQHSQKLFPIRLDDYILGDEVLRLADKKMAEGAWPEDWVRYVRRYHIPDFSRWKDHDAYQGEFNKLLRDLKEPPVR